MAEPVLTPEEVGFRGSFKWLRFNKWIVLGGIALALTISAAWFAASDEPLDPEARKILEQPFGVPPEKNMFFAIWGLNASPDLNAPDVGRKIIAAYHEATAANGMGAKVDSTSFLGSAPMKMPKDRMLNCDRSVVKAGCIAHWENQRQEIERQWLAQSAFLPRYRMLRAYDAYEDAVVPYPTSPLPNWRSVTHLSRLTDAKLALDMAVPGKRTAALRELEAEFMLWRVIAEGASAMLTRMIASDSLNRKYALLSDILHQYPEVTQSHADQVSRLTQPLPVEFADMRRVFEGEFRLQAKRLFGIRQSLYVGGEANFIEAIAPWEKPFMGLVFKQNTTVNKSSRFFRELAALSALESAKLSETLAGLTARYVDVASPYPSLHNPMGNILLGVSLPIYDEYIYRVHDLIAASRVVELQRRIILEKIPPQQITTYLSASNRALYDPYTNAPMKLDATKGRLSFERPRNTGIKRMFFAQVADAAPLGSAH
jgi:hypothetical protein